MLPSTWHTAGSARGQQWEKIPKRTKLGYKATAVVVAMGRVQMLKSSWDINLPNLFSQPSNVPVHRPGGDSAWTLTAKVRLGEGSQRV